MKHEVITPYTPEHNGIAKRKNRSIMNTARSMLKSKEIPTRFWGETHLTLAYILNRFPTKKIVHKTPYEFWTTLKPNVSHLRVFGSMSFNHVPS